MKIVIKNIILFAILLIMNLYSLFYIIFHINNLNISVLFYFIFIIPIIYFLINAWKEIINIQLLKSLFGNEFLLNKLSNIVTDYIFEKNKFNKIFMKAHEHKKIIELVKEYFPLSNLYFNDNLSAFMKNEDKVGYCNLLKDELIKYNDKIKVPYHKIYGLLVLNLILIILIHFK